jgi:hypothetical protein
MSNRELYTKDDVPLTEVTERVEQLIDWFNEAERPFMEVFVEEMDQQTFLQEIEVDPDEWEKLSEGEFPGSDDPQDPSHNQMTFRTEEYGKALNMSQRFVEKSTAAQIERKVQRMLEGAKQTQERVIHDVIFSGVYDGTGGLWFDIPDYGNYTFTDSHSHEFADSNELFGDSDAHAPHEHIEVASETLKEHGWTGTKVALVSVDWKRYLRNEVTWDMGYHIPMADGLRSADVRDIDFAFDNTAIIQSPYVTGDEFYIVDPGIKPVKYYEDRPLQLTRPQGGPLLHPGELVNAAGTMSFGAAMVNPLGAAHFAGDSVNLS